MDANKMIRQLVDGLVAGIHDHAATLKTLTYHEPLADVVLDVGGSRVEFDDIGFEYADQLRAAQHKANTRF